jgi:hypothetical protein
VVEIQFSPEPTPEEREALLRALAVEDDRARPDRWWEDGVREAVELEAES